MSIQPLYYLLQGDPQYYGLTLGIYDLGLIVIAPCVAKYIEATHKFRVVFLSSMVCAIIGNTLYAIILYLYFNTGLGSNGWILLIFARLIMGFGSVNVLAGPTYITYNSKFTERLGVLGSYQNMQSVSRIVGPFIGFLFVGMNQPAPNSSVAVQLFNFYTMAAWLSLLFATIAFCIVLYFFRDQNAPNYMENEKLKNFDWVNCDKSKHSIFFNTIMNSFVLFLFGYVQYSIIANMFAFGTSTFRVVTQQEDLWIPFLPLGIGAGGASIVWRRIAKRWVTNKRQEKYWSLLGSSCAIAAPFFFIAYTGTEGTQPQALLWVGGILLGAANVWQFGNLEVIFSKQITQHYEEVGASISTFFSWYTVSQSCWFFDVFFLFVLLIFDVVLLVTRFLGPFVTGFVLPITDFSQANASPCTTASGALDLNSTCCFVGSKYQISTCEMQSVNIYIPILTGVTFLSFCMTLYYVFYLVNYPEELVEGVIKKKDSDDEEVLEHNDEAKETDRLLPS